MSPLPAAAVPTSRSSTRNNKEVTKGTTHGAGSILLGSVVKVISKADNGKIGKVLNVVRKGTVQVQFYGNGGQDVNKKCESLVLWTQPIEDEIADAGAHDENDDETLHSVAASAAPVQPRSLVHSQWMSCMLVRGYGSQQWPRTGMLELLLET
jgi:hypothetical protein